MPGWSCGSARDTIGLRALGLGRRVIDVLDSKVGRFSAWRSRLPAPAAAWRPTQTSRADPVFTANIAGLGASFLLPQRSDDLLFTDPTRLHVHPLPGDGLYPFLEEFAGLRSIA
jgi:hypothetical protein